MYKLSLLNFLYVWTRCQEQFCLFNFFVVFFFLFTCKMIYELLLLSYYPHLVILRKDFVTNLKDSQIKGLLI